MNALAVTAGAVIAITGFTHSLLGERKLLGPLFRSNTFAEMPRAGRAMRFTWHLATLLMLLTALTVAWPGTPAAIVKTIGTAYLLLGLLAFKVSRGRHISGPLFMAAGLLALVA